MTPPRFLIIDGEPPEARAKRRESVGRSSAETYCDTLRQIEPGASCQVLRPGEPNAPEEFGLRDADGIFLTGSPLHLYKDTSETRPQVELMRAIFGSGTPCFGSCAGLQVATVAAGGTVRAVTSDREAAFARRIRKTDAGRPHPLLTGRPDVFDAPAIHTDEVETLPEGARVLATNPVTAVQAAEIAHDGGVFWGVQYHPELSLGEVAAALRRQCGDLIKEGFARSTADLEGHAGLIDELGREPGRRDLAWRLGLDREVTETERRTRELRNFIDRLVKPCRSARLRA